MGLTDPLHIPLTHLNIRGMILLQINILEWLETAFKFVMRSQSLDLDQAEQFPRQIFASKNFGSKKFKSMKQNVV